MKLKKILVFAVALVGGFSFMSAQGGMPEIPVDTAVHTGKLANGLTYYVRYNNYPEHHVNFYIAQRVGSIQEEESQRGLAHFLEHMAFNGTDHYPGNGVIDYTRTLGVEFGRDLNAYTAVDQTVYNINDVPSNRQSALDSCLLILKDWSNGLLLEGNEIDKERGVIHEEWRLRSSASQRMLNNNLEALYPGSKYGKRMPIGLMSVVDNFKYKEIRDYYHKWYRPDNQAIVVVGDIDVNYTINKIKELFGAIPAPAANAAQVVDEPVPDNSEAIYVIDKDKEQQYGIVQLMYKHDPFPEQYKNSAAYLLTSYATEMACDMLNKRLEEKSQEPDCPFLQAGSSDGQYIFAKTKDAFTLFVLPKPGKTAEALQSVTEEALRARQFGFTETEYARTRADYLSSLESRYNSRSKIPSDRFGRLYASNYLSKEPLMSIETEYQMMNQFAPNIPVALINQAMQELVSVSDTNLVVMNFNQEKEGEVYPTKAQLKGAIDAAHAAKLTAYVDKVKNEPLIKELPKKGSIVKETQGTKFDYKELTLSNGVKVILKPTKLKDDEILMSAEAKGGSSLYGEKDWGNTELFGYVIGMSGLGEFDNTELQKALAGKKASAGLSMSTSYDRLSGQSTVKDLETMFQLTYLNMTSIKKDEKNFNMLVSQLETFLKNKGLKPETAFRDSVSYTLGNHNWRNKPYEASDLKKLNYDRILEIAKERTANAANYTFYFVGDFDEATIKPLIEQYIASLPATKERSNYVNVFDRPKGKVVNNFSRKMETPIVNISMNWFTTATPYSLENSIKARVAGQILDKVYLQKIREEAGASYSPNAGGSGQLTGDVPYYTIVGTVSTKIEQTDLVLDIMRKATQDLTKTVDAATLKDIKSVMIKDANESEKENSHWLNVLNMWTSRGIDTQSDYKKIVESLTPASISKFVKDVILKSGNVVEVVMTPEQ